jgi:tRNA(Ile)-lysidine synthetase-like protein
MAEINPGVIESIARAAENLGNDRDVLDSLSSTLLNEARIESSAPDDVSTSYSVRTLLNHSSGVRRRLILEALRRARVGEGEISSVHVSDVEDLLQPDSSGKRILLPGGLEVWREFDGLVIKRSVVESNDYQFEISAAEPVCRAGNFAIAFQRGLSGAMRNIVVAATKRERARTGLNWMGVVLVDDALPKLLIIRPRRAGERAHVIGQQKTKKLKKLMIDHRIPSSRRANWPLVTTPDGRYVWSPGLPPAVEFTAHDESQCVAVLQASGI